MHSMFSSRLGFTGRRIEWRYLWFDKIQDGGWWPSWIYKNGHNFATALPIDMMFGPSMRFSGSADLIVQLSVTLCDPEPQFQGHSIVQRRISRKRCIRSTLSLVLGKGFRGRWIEWHYFPFDNIQDGGWRPSWNSRHLEMTALSSVRVTLASAGLSCCFCTAGIYRLHVIQLTAQCVPDTNNVVMITTMTKLIKKKQTNPSMRSALHCGIMRRNPAHCSNVFDPRPAIDRSWDRQINGPSDSRRSTIFLANLSLIPEICLHCAHKEITFNILCKFCFSSLYTSYQSF